MLLVVLINSKGFAQDPTFSQWEQIPIYFNPALTGDFEGTLRLRAKYRDQWRSILGDDAFVSGVASAEYKFAKGDQRKISVGFHTLHDRAGEAVFTTNSYNLSAAVIQNLGDPAAAHHNLSVGFSIGLASKKLDLDGLIFNPFPGEINEPEENLNEKTSYGDLSLGINWNYRSNNHFSSQFGLALSHVNTPNVSFTGDNNSNLSSRFNLHGNIEIPIIHQLSIVPSFLYINQGSSDQLLFGFNSKWYLNQTKPDFVQLGFFLKNTLNFNGRAINVYVISATVEVKSIVIGFAYDRFTKIINGSNAYEFSLGYTIGRGSTNQAKK